ncbi:ribonuclease HIII [bacterium B17]|nr:ribonuclease HIII [bacterium B17]
MLESGNYQPTEVPHTIISASTGDCNINLYKSGKCLVQGKGAGDFVTFIMEPSVLQRAEYGYEDVLSPEKREAHMGIDESGKGDFFGPMVIASVYVDGPLVDKMREMDVKDSKNITSDQKALNLGRDLRQLLGKQFSIVKIGPQAYNRLYSKMQNVNVLLSWGHARAIENLLEDVPSCPRAISDQFGRKDQVEKALMKKGQKIELIQMHKAESDIAVAAASIIARESFLRALIDMGKKHDVELPKGASAAVKEIAIELVKKNGPEVLLETTKCHFKTADEVLKAAGSDRSALGPEGQAVSKIHRKK